MDLSRKIKDEAGRLGFDICGIAKTRPLDQDRQVMKNWIDSGMNAEMKYLERDLDKRSNPVCLFPGARSLVVTGTSYNTRIKQHNEGVPVISKYAYGRDYHIVIREKLEALLTSIQAWMPGIRGKAVVDSSPVLEKAWALEAGIGWRGKHSVIINRSIGSFFFIGILILDSDLEYDTPLPGDICGNCRLCIDNCPTGAINENRTIDARKCIANLTIENRDPIPEEIVPKLSGRVYGCDRCQEVCPWNEWVKQHDHTELMPDERIINLDRTGWLNLSEEEFYRLFKATAMNRVNYGQFVRNLHDALKSLS